MHEQLRELVGKKVAVWTIGSQSGYKDEGTFERCDGSWLRLKKGKEIFLIPVTAIRLIKPLDQVHF